MLQQKSTQNAIAAMSRLAELYKNDTAVASAREIAKSRNLPAPIVAKIMSELSRGGLVTGSPGPGGGYRLAKPPIAISLKDVAVLFEREMVGVCAFGLGQCKNNDLCPLHDSMLEMRRVFDDYLSDTSFAVFENRDELNVS